MQLALPMPDWSQLERGIARELDPIARLLWAFVSTACLVLTTWIVFSDFTFRDSGAAFASLLLLSIGVSGVLLRLRGWRRLGHLFETYAHFTGFAVAVALISVVLASTAVSYRDPQLMHIDRLVFGLDWLSMANAANSSPQLMTVFSYAYASLMQQPLPLILLLFALNKVSVARTFVLAWCITLIVCLAVFPFAPALGGYLHNGIAREDTHVLVAAAWRHIEILGPVRDGTLRALGSGTIEGIITFPSFHAAAAVLMMWAFWAIRWVRWPAFVLNVFMLASTPIIGGHYVIDVVAGVAVAVGAIVLARRVAERGMVEPSAASKTSAPPDIGAGNEMFEDIRRGA